MKSVYEAKLVHDSQFGSEDRQLFTNLDKAHDWLQKQHEKGEWYKQPFPEKHLYRDKLKTFSSHTITVVDPEEEREVEYTIEVRPIH